MAVYNNKSDFDPGRFRYKVAFYQEGMVDDGFGGTVPGETLVIETRAIRNDVGSNRFSALTQFAVEAGASVFNQDRFFVIRHRSGFVPQKDMVIVSDGVKYTIRGVMPIDEPTKYWRILAIRRD